MAMSEPSWRKAVTLVTLGVSSSLITCTLGSSAWSLTINCGLSLTPVAAG
jgi:hypothetical protein